MRTTALFKRSELELKLLRLRRIERRRSVNHMTCERRHCLLRLHQRDCKQQASAQDLQHPAPLHQPNGLVYWGPHFLLKSTTGEVEMAASFWTVKLGLGW